MRTTWERWSTQDMTDAAEAEDRTCLEVLAPPEREFVETLPYYGAFSDYKVHVTGCRDCRRDDREDCPAGDALRMTARIGLEVQERMAARN